MKKNNNEGINKLPPNRFTAFFLLLKGNFKEYIYLSLLTTIFFLPLFLLFLGKQAYYLTIVSSETLVFSKILGLDLVYGLLRMPLFMIGFLALEGLIGVLRKIFFKENYLLISDFFASIRKNYRGALLAGFLFSFVLLVININMDFISYGDATLPLYIKIIILIVSLIVGLFLMMMVMFILPLNAIYDLSLGNLIKNSTLLAIGYFFKNFVFVIAIMWPLILMELFFNIFVSIILFVLVSTLFMAIIMSIDLLYATNIFDLAINAKYCKELYRKGLSQ